MSSSVVLSKELREQYLNGGRPAWSLVINGVLMLLFAVGAPIFFAGGPFSALEAALLAAGVVFCLICFLALIGPMVNVVDLLAGERERHTLETLLSTPVSRGALFAGKALSALLPVVAMSVLSTVASTLLLASLFGVTGFLVGLGLILVGALGAAFVATLITGLGLWISASAVTVKQGQQWLSYAIIPIFIPIGVLPQLMIRDGFGSVPSPTLILVASIVSGAVFLLVNAFFWAMAWRATGRLLGKPV
jgi:ABC-type Na+ efflux pump permease subunit